MTNSPSTLIRPPPPVAELALFRNEHPTHSLSRRTIAADGVAHRLFLAVPRSSPPAGGFPILYLLDGNAAFDLMDAGQLAAASGLILAGIGHDTDLRFDPPARSRDYTPARHAGDPYPDPNRPDRLIGGAGAFLQRLTGPIRESVEAGLPVDPARRMLFGHSLAGMFALYTLLKRPGAFRHIAAASPSIWWGDEIMLELEAKTGDPGEPHDVLITLGDSERRSSPAGPHWQGPAPHTLEMIRRLSQRNNISVTSRVLEGLGHAATLPATLPLLPAFARNG
ncbi:alpha/beta hydrolase-fold protein [Rhizobiaceae bacterium BDR2-2]|uniref:Alpha/beta hydrolase-fold protein n=1 Tax=Ectorhizobium quercum TaxID=2965071 RepID=A0AAE3STB7_9HYPH|nr:alpha/beta hydrolase-fold protein [Ectorhizobium quercum]MCX8995975.1 alpha/beta hydrolase-fold protein [Ectorhizobium quercum]